MEINPIRNENDYKMTLKEIELLWESPIDSPEGDRLDVLVTLEEAYETEHYPNPKTGARTAKHDHKNI